MFLILLIVTIVILLLLLTNWYFTKNYNYFERKGIPVYKRHNVYIDTYQAFSSTSVICEEIYEQYNGLPNKAVYGTYHIRIPFLLIKDPDLLKQILIKDFDHFTDHSSIVNPDDFDPFLGKSLFSLRGKRWHDMRVTLSPAFTGSKMRGMVGLMNEIGEQVIDYLIEKVNEANSESGEKVLKMNMGDICTRFTNDAIASIAFGVKIDSLKYPNNDFYRAGQYVQNLKFWRFILIILFPRFCKMINFKGMPNWIYDFFINMVRETLETRDRENIIRPDMLHLLNEAKKGRLVDDDDDTEDKSSEIKGDKIPLTLEDIVGQGFFFFIAGFSSVAVTMCWTLYELALNPDIQEKLYDDINETLQEFENKITYEAIMKMKYLDMTVTETLRKWPPVAATNRGVTKPYCLKTKGGEFNLEVGMSIAIPIFGLQRDPKYYPDPDRFDPERFRDPSQIHPCTYLPFGIGPRICIGSRLAILEVKVFLVMLLTKFEFTVIDKTPIPPVLKPGQALEPTVGFWLGLKRRQAH